MNFKYKIKSVDKETTLVSFLTEKYTYYSLEEWIKQLVDEKIKINNRIVNADCILNQNDEISFTMEEFQEPPVDENISIVYEDEYLFAVNKSGNLPVHPAGRYRTHNLTTLLKKLNLISNEFFIVNRLDRETSGIVLFGKSTVAASKLCSLFENSNIQKTYICYVQGFFPEKLSANGYLAKDFASKIRKKKKFTYKKTETSLWEVNTDFALIQSTNGISKIYAYPHTGKIHQIRATLYSLGYPVVGDKIYGNDENIFLQFIETGATVNNSIIDRQALHAYSLEFIHPFTGNKFLIRAEEPIDMCKIISLVTVLT